MVVSNYARAFLYFSVVSTCAVPLAVYDQVTASNLLSLVTIGLGITVVAAAVFFGVYFFLRITRIEIRQWWLFSILVSAGAIRGVSMFVSISQIGLEQPTTLFQRILASIATTVIWVQFFAWITEQFERFNNKYVSKLKRNMIRYVSIDADSNSGVDSRYEKEIAGLESLLRKTLDPVVAQQYSKENLLIAAEKLRDYVQEVIRPLSREIWLSRDAMPRFHRTYVLRRAISRPQFESLLTSLFIAGLVFSNIAPSESLLRGFIATVVIFSFTFPTFILINHLNQRRALGAFANLLLFLGPGLLSGFLFLEINKTFFGEDSGIFSWVGVLLILGIGVIASMIGVVNMSQAQLIEELDKSWKSTGIGAIRSTDSETGKLASYLHNTLQSELLALSLQMEQVARNPTGLEARGLLEKIQSTLKRSLADHFYEVQMDPIKRLEKLTSSWSGLLDIHLSVDEITRCRPEIQNLVVGTIEESITNAFRHGGAKNFRASLYIETTPTVELVLWSDSEWSNVQGSGLGQQWILDNCLSMTRESAHGGYQLTVVFPSPAS